jgi:hypothetical protein
LFYFGTLEEYYVGGLHLRPGNGITDGCFPIIGMYIMLFFTGAKLMTSEIIPGNEHTRGSTLIVYFCVLFTCKTLHENFSAIFCKPADNEAGEKVVLKNVVT